jgi:hypothetical protein
MSRLKIEEFQKRLHGLALGHGTHKDNIESIRSNGLVRDYNYACVGEGWEIHGENHANVLIIGSSVASRTYPDPEGQWGEGIVHMREAVAAKGLEATLDELERCLNGDGWLEDFGDDVSDPHAYNLVIIGPVSPNDIIA